MVSVTQSCSYSLGARTLGGGKTYQSNKNCGKYNVAFVLNARKFPQCSRKGTEALRRNRRGLLKKVTWG